MKLIRMAAICCALAAAPAAFGDDVLFSDNFDAGTSGLRWTTRSQASDFNTDFFFDYSTRGIPSAPNSTGGTTRGLRLAVNKNDAVAATDAVSVFPTSPTFSGDFRLNFDLWIGYTGGAGGGTGSTEFATWGMHHSGNQALYITNAAADGYWFGVTGEGGDSNDYRAYRNATFLSVADGGFAAGSLNHTAAYYQSLFPSPTYQTAGAPGKHWVEVEAATQGGVITWRINGSIIAQRTDLALSSGKISLGTMDTFASISGVLADNFALFDNVRVTAIPPADCNSNGIADATELAAGSAADCNNTDVIDACEALSGGDYTADGIVDGADYVAFASCLSGPAASPSGACASTCSMAFDDDADTHVSLRDFAALQRHIQTSKIPPRPPGAPTGSAMVSILSPLSLSARDARIIQEITSGNVPDFLRTFVPITVSANISGTQHTAVYYAARDYLAIGTDADFFRMPMMPYSAQSIADSFGCLLTTRKMCNDIWTQAPIKLAPQPISPNDVDITLVTTFWQHQQMVEAQRNGQPFGLIAGIKKDVVITALLPANPGKVAIYGWHQLNGTPIQPLYLGHNYLHVDYSHGIRLVNKWLVLDGVPRLTADILADPALNVLLSDEGVVTQPRYQQ